MAITFNEQANVPNASGVTTALDADGEGMHSLLAYDMVRALNNLGTYVNNHTHYAQNQRNGRLTVTYVGGAREIFMCQMHVIIPLWATRMIWTCGARGTVGLTAVTVYLARELYTGVDGATGAFDTSNLATGYSSRAISVSASGGAYALAIDDTAGITPINNDNSRGFNFGSASNAKRHAYAIITASGGVNDTLTICDFTCWFSAS